MRHLLLGAAVMLLAGCASHSLIPRDQAKAIAERERSLAVHADAIQATIRQSRHAGGLAFLDNRDARLVVLPGDTPAEAWTRHRASPGGETAQVSIPAVITFVYRADVPAAPETVAVRALEEQQALGASLAALQHETRDAEQRTAERLRETQRELAEALAAAKQEADRALVAASADTQRAIRAVADDLAAARAFMLQTAQLGWLTHDLAVENARTMQRVEAASQSLAATSARLAAAMQQLSEGLPRQLKELVERIEAIRTKMNEIK
jgi:hypothetical protein